MIVKSGRRWPRVLIAVSAVVIAAFAMTSLAVTGGAVAGPASPALVAGHRASDPLPITAFQEDGDPDSLITRSAPAITTVDADGVNINAAGDGVVAPSAITRRSLKVAHRDRLHADFLVGNFDNGIDDFSEQRANNLLSSPANIKTVAAELAGDVTKQGWDGISVDLESLHSRDRHGLVEFLQTLRGDLPSNKTLTMCVTNFTSVTTFRQWGYDLGGIGRAVSQVILMAYDEHGPWENSPGPVGALTWQEAGLKVVKRFVPAGKIDLGEAGYGYGWRPHSNDQYSDAQARALVKRAGAKAHFDRKVGEWTAHLPDGSTLWWADARSLALRESLAQREHLHGLAVWDLGLSDPIR